MKNRRRSPLEIWGACRDDFARLGEGGVKLAQILTKL